MKISVKMWVLKIFYTLQIFLIFTFSESPFHGRSCGAGILAGNKNLTCVPFWCSVPEVRPRPVDGRTERARARSKADRIAFSFSPETRDGHDAEGEIGVRRRSAEPQQSRSP